MKGTFSADQWMENFRMTKATFEILCDDLRSSFPDLARSVWEPLQLDHRVAIAVYWMASSAEYRTIANLFGVGKSTVHKCIHDVCTAMAETILDKYVKLPADDDLQHVIDGFDNTWGFPSCARAVDGTHIPIIAPGSAHGNYVNRNGWYSIILQAVCDHNYIITDMNVGWPGRVHDVRVFGNSGLYYKGETNDLFPQKTKKLVCPGKEITMPIVLLGNAAYPLTNRANLTAAQRVFNYRLSRARMTIESTFGRLMGKWRCLQNRPDVSVDFASTIVTACAIIHNLCEKRHKRYMDEEGEEEHEERDDRDGDGGS